MQIAATLGTVGSDGSGRMPFAHSARTLPSVSFPSSVVRSIIRIARSSAHNFDSRLIERFLRLSTRSSTPTWSTPPTRSTIVSMPSPRPTQARTSALAWRSADRVAGASRTLLTPAMVHLSLFRAIPTTGELSCDLIVTYIDSAMTDLDDVLRALADPTRRDLLRTVIRQPGQSTAQLVGRTAGMTR